MRTEAKARKTTMIYDARTTALSVARLRQQRTGRRHFVAYDASSRGWLVTDRMPLLGEWYDADGHRHG